MTHVSTDGFAGPIVPADPDSIFKDYQHLSSESRGADNFQSIEKSIRLPEGFVVTGMGMTCYQNDINYLKVEGRPIMNDGSLGPRQQFEVGSTRRSTPEAFASVDDNYVVIGFGGNIYRNNVNTLVLVYRRYNPRTRRLEGPEHVMARGTRPDPGNYESLIRTHDTGGDLDRKVFVGVGMNASGSDLNRISGLVGTLKPPL